MDCEKHQCNKKCGELHSHSSCKMLVDVRLSCGHVVKKECWRDDSQMQCTAMVKREFPACRHTRKIECWRKVTDFNCMEKVRSMLDCGHVFVHKCSEDIGSMCCNSPCGKALVCGHACQRTCGEPCADCRECVELAKRQVEDARRSAKRRAKQLAQYISMSEQQDMAFAIDIPDNGDEFCGIKALVINFIKPDHAWYPKITRIERVTNPRLEQNWLEARSGLFDPVRDDERKFHGTDDEAIKNICFGEGFRLPAESNNNMFGQGIYFASNSSKSAQDKYLKGSNKLLLCKVLLGKSLTAKTAMNDLTAEKLKRKGFDSVFAPPGSQVINDEFVVYDPRQALVTHIIHFVKSPATYLTLPATLGRSKDFKITTMHANRSVNLDDPYEVQFAIAEARFYRLQTSAQRRITQIDIVENPALEAKFSQKQAEFKGSGTPSDFIFAFHGTKKENIDKIIRNNFDLKKFKHGAYGFGIYFSEQPEVSTGYSSDSKSMLLCKLLRGLPDVNCKVLIWSQSLKNGWIEGTWNDEGDTQHFRLSRPFLKLPTRNTRVSDPHFFLRIRIRAKIIMRIRIRILGVSGGGGWG